MSLEDKITCVVIGCSYWCGRFLRVQGGLCHFVTSVCVEMKLKGQAMEV